MVKRKNMRRKGFAGKSRRSQMEIMGLMVVVILLIVGVLFALKFVVLKKPAETRQEYSRTQMASNMGLALMSATTENCRETAIKDLLIDCAQWPEAGGTITCGDGSGSCDYVNRTIGHILNSTLNQWRVRYYFSASTSNIAEDRLVYHTNGDCTMERPKPGESESFFLPTGRGMMTLRMFICS